MRKAKVASRKIYECYSKKEINICVSCPLPDCEVGEKGCARLNAELKKLKEKE